MALRRQITNFMKKYNTPTIITTPIYGAFALCDPSPGSTNIQKDAPGIEGGGTQMAPGRKVF